MSHSYHVGGLPDSRPQTRLQQLSIEFVRAWQAASSLDQAPDLGKFLPAVDETQRRSTLELLLRIDIEERWRRRQHVYVEHYLERFPDLGTAVDLPATLILEEYRVRQQFGDQPPLPTYQRRFPTQYPELLRLIQGEEDPTVTPDGGKKNTRVGERLQTSSELLSHTGYKLLEQIGRGSYGEVWRAEAPGGFEAALKIMHRPAGHEDVKRELQALEAIKRLHHPFLLATTAYWQGKDQLIIAMELAHDNLYNRVQQCKDSGLMGIPEKELLGYFHEAAKALDYLHANNVHHRDVKPANLLLQSGHMKVADFGLARVVEGMVMAEATFCGTPLYIAPEVWEGKIGSSSDLYSLAVTYVELRIGRRPFAGKSLPEIKLEHRDTTPGLDPLGAREQHVILRALAKDPAQRQKSCQEFVEQLIEAVPDSTRHRVQWEAEEVEEKFTGTGRDSGEWRVTEPEPQPVPPPPPPPRRLGPLLRACLTICGAAASLVLLWFILNRPDPQPGPGPKAEGSFTLQQPSNVMVDRDGKATLKLTVKRDDFNMPVVLSAASIPPGIQVQELELGPGEETGTLEITANQSAEAGQRPVTIRALGGNLDREKTFVLTVIKMPRGCRPRKRERDPQLDLVKDSLGLLFHRRIEYVSPGGGPPFEFLVVPKGDSTITGVDPDTFYIMEDKVSVAQFDPFARDEMNKVLPGIWNAREDKDCPALRIKGLDAYSFATVWIKGGNLPRLDQWDKAAGRYATSPREGPYKGTWMPGQPAGDIAVGGLKRPLKCGQARLDVSPAGCRDMSGNGLEWTRSQRDNGWVHITRAKLAQATNVQLRGWDYVMPGPYQFAEEDFGGIQSYHVYDKEAFPNIGFRVVLEP